MPPADEFNPLLKPGRVAVFVGHPGHELLVHHFMERCRPTYLCLTDGSGGNAAPRVGSTGRLLDRIGATWGPIRGRFTDKELYRLLLDGRVDVFLALADELSDILIDAGVEFVAGDKMEGFNPGHDLARALLDRAVAIVHARTGRVLKNYEFAVHDDPPSVTEGTTIRLQLDGAALDRKMAAAWAYTELHDEVLEVVERVGRDAFAIEYIRPTSSQALLEQLERVAPRYEQVGSQRVAAGRYDAVVRYRQHVLPVFEALGVIPVRDLASSSRPA
jgi:hypothetical protein